MVSVTAGVIHINPASDIFTFSPSPFPSRGFVQMEAASRSPGTRRRRRRGEHPLEGVGEEEEEEEQEVPLKDRPSIRAE